MSAIRLEVVVHNALVSAIPEALGGKLSGPLQDEHYAALTSAIVTAIYDTGSARIRELEAQNAELRRHRVKLIEVGAQIARELEAGGAREEDGSGWPPPCQSPACGLRLSACVCGSPFGDGEGTPR